METNPMAVALISIIGTILVVLLGLLITMLRSLKVDLDTRCDALYSKIDAITERLTHMVLSEDYREDKREITLKLDEHGDRLLVLEIRVKEAKREDKS
jgi:hypothetical protein